MGSKKPIGQAQIAKYAKLVLGRTAGHGESPFDLCSDALEKENRLRGFQSARQHCYKHADFIIRRVASIKVKALEAKLSKPQPTHVPTKRRGITHQKANADEFLSSYSWRQLRMQALRKYGPKCMCCGATPDNGAVMNVDHIKPRRLFPNLALDLDNLQILCHECNHGKGNWDQTDWRPVDTDSVDDGVMAMLREIARDK